MGLAKYLEEIQIHTAEVMQGLSEKNYEFAPIRLEEIKLLISRFDNYLKQCMDYATDPNILKLDLLIENQSLKRKQKLDQVEIQNLKDSTYIERIRIENEYLRRENSALVNEALNKAREEQQRDKENYDLRVKVKYLINKLLLAEIKKNKNRLNQQENRLNQQENRLRKSRKDLIKPNAPIPKFKKVKY